MKKIEIHVFCDVFFLFHLRCVMTKGAMSSSVNKKSFTNIYAPHGAKFRFIFSVEAKPVQSK